MASEANIKRWLKREHELVPFPYKFKLRQLELEQDGMVLQEWESDSEGWRVDPIAEVDRLAAAILETSAMAVKASSYRIKLQLRSCIKKRGQSKLETRANLIWDERGQARDAEQGSMGEMEPATSSGLLAQLMRHNEKNMAMVHDMVESTLGQLKAENFDLRKHRNLDDSEWMGRRKQMEKLIDRGAERDLAVKKLQSENDRKDAMLAQLVTQVLPAVQKHLPMLLDGLFGKKGAEELKGIEANAAAASGISAMPPGMGNAAVEAPPPANDSPPAEVDESEGGRMKRDLQRIIKALPQPIVVSLALSLKPSEQEELMSWDAPGPVDTEKMRSGLKRIYASLSEGLAYNVLAALGAEDRQCLADWLESEPPKKAKAKKPIVEEDEDPVVEVMPTPARERRIPPGVKVRQKEKK